MSGRTKIPGMLDLAPTQDVLVHQLDRMVAQVVLPKQKQYEPDTPSPSKAWTVSPTDLAFSSYAVGRDQLRVLIVGAGFAGLSAAIACARQGMAVTVPRSMAGRAWYYDTPSYPALVTRDEEVLEADVILIADGVNSASRELLAPRSDENLHERSKSDYSIFRAATKSDAFKSDKLTAQVLAHLGGWDPVLVRAISLFPGSLNWSLPNETPAPDWVSGGGAICFLGDSIHPMTTTTYQGGSSAIEDGATIAIALGMAGNRPKDVRLALRTFQDLRMSRVEDITAVGVEQRRAWHSYHHERDPALLPLLTLQFYHFDAELFALQNFERLARKHDKHFEVTDDAFDHDL
ncbi:hypothetical protein RQP46_004552 [Phenoliferia psychrophenolica]